MLELLSNPQTWIAFATLTALELVLGIDNIIFISILVDKLPKARQEFARRLGLFMAMFMRIGLLLVLAWIVGLVEPLFTLPVVDVGISGRDLILIGGGLFLIWKSTVEIHGSLEGEDEVEKNAGKAKAAFAVLAGNCMLPEHGPDVAPQIHPRIMPVGTYIIGTAPLSEAQCRQLIPSFAAVCDNNFVLDYFRFSADRRLLFGGRVSYTTMTPRHLEDTMRERLVAVFPELRTVPVEHLWGGFVDISMNRAPDFGRLGSNLYYLQGFSGHGVALTGLAGQLVAEAVLGQAGRFDLSARLKHHRFPGGPLLRTPSLALGMLWHRLRDVV